ncbi:O-antigen/teichoic acid export membrane protein [Kerstersia gyiorum]|uniref:O-antigen/teichoic acid export membrane protein n=2 Tax=Kerstersia gyiorum TaxID=206506 RepID=A0A4V2EZS2_9BURK|nr:oligosaccharide flippase family protein [Kerstersia gyiorum]KAB0542988.1 oligosaccharide flippase family protein [Kerstersia gyiorum]RZS67480.1 O-antigen/teichoic acid export membrane protein [Kerstersia gyiorum]
MNFIKNKFIRNVILIATGTAGAQIISIIFAPLITRLYGPEAFGVLGTFVAVLAIMTPIAALTLPIAIVLPKDDNEAVGIAKLSFFLSLILSLAVAIVIIVAENDLIRLMNLEDVSNYLLLIPVAMFLNALQQIIQQWLIRKKQFKVSARIAVSQSFIVNVAKVGAGYFYPFGAVLIVITTLGNALYAVQLWLGEKKWVNKENKLKLKVETPDAKKIFLKYSDFPKFRAPQVFLNAISQSFPVLILAAFYGTSVAGYFTLSKTIISAPAVLLGISIGNVFYAQIVELINLGKNPVRIFQKSTAITFLIGVLPFGFVMIFGGEVFSFVFGEEWFWAGVYAKYVSVWMLFSLAARPAIALIPAIKMQGVFLFLEVFFTILKVMGFLVGIYIYNDPLSSVIIYSMISAFFYLFLYFLVLKRVNSSDLNYT